MTETMTESKKEPTAKAITEESPDVKSSIKLSKKERTKDWIKPPKSIMKLVGKAMAQYQMLREFTQHLILRHGFTDQLHNGLRRFYPILGALFFRKLDGRFNIRALFGYRFSSGFFF